MIDVILVLSLPALCLYQIRGSFADYIIKRLKGNTGGDFCQNPELSPQL
jgi:hypothetical protein